MDDGDLNRYIVVRVATVLTGYTQDNIERAWEMATAKAADLIGLATYEAKRQSMDLHQQAPFTATAPVSASLLLTVLFDNPSSCLTGDRYFGTAT